MTPGAGSAELEEPAAPAVAARAGRSTRRAGRLLLLAWLVAVLPLLFGSRTLYLRDALNVHAPWKSFGAAELARGSVPAFNPTWGNGLPFRGNPNALPFYPDNLLYLILPFWTAFNLHFLLHWLLAFVGVRALAREMGQGEAGALVAAITFAGSGYLLSGLNLYNLVTTVAWWPLVLLGAARGGVAALAGGGLACALALLGGEPVTAALGVVPLALVAWERHGFRRGVARAAAILALGAGIALPQIVAFLRVLPHSVRALQGVAAEQAGAFSLRAPRLVELLVPLPWGDPSRFGAEGWWGERIAHGMPLFGSLYFGAVGLALALGGARRRARWALLGLAGLALAWLGGEAPERVVGWTGGLFRYPEKLLLWSVLSAALLAGWRVADAFRAPEGARASRLPWTLAATCLLGLGLLVVAGPMLSEALAAKSGPEGARSAIRMLDASLFRWELALGIGALSLALLPLALARRSGGAVVALQLVGLLQLAPLVPTMPTAPLREPGGFTAETPPGDGVLNAALTFPPLRPLPAYRLEGESAAAIREVQARELSPAAGVPRGLVYPLAPDLEGLCTPAYKELQRTLPGLSEAERIAWFRRTGVDRLVLFRVPEAEGLEWLGSAESLGAPSYLFGVESPVPAAYRPARVVRVESEAEARRRAGAEPDPTAVAFVAGAEASAGPGPVAPVAWQADRLVVDVGERPGLVVLRRTFHPLYRARCEATPARTLPVDSLLLGVEVPAGCGRLTVDVSSLPEWLATIVAAPLALVALFVSRRGRRARAPLRSRRPRPAGTSRSAG